MNKCSIRYFVTILLLCTLAVACDDPTVEPVEQNDGSDQTAQQKPDEEPEMYFPPATGDEWDSVNAAALGWNIEHLEEAVQFAKERNTYSLLILHKGRIVSENYWRNYTDESQHDLESAAKSMTAFVIGKLQEQGALQIDDPVSHYLNDGWLKGAPTEGQITIRHLLTMTSGLNNSLSVIGEPGKVWYYSHRAYGLLFPVIEAATGVEWETLFDTLLFGEIGMNEWRWQSIDLYTTARDMGKFGLMILNRGSWNGKDLINDDSYFDDMLSTSQSIQEAYGYLWWLNGKASYHNGTELVEGPIYETMPADAWLAMGKKDQRIEVIPSLELVVVRQGGETGLPEKGEGSFDYEFWLRLMKAIKNDTPQF